MKAQSSTLPKVEETKEKWYIVDAKGLVIGRVAARIAKILRGKTLTTYTPHLDPKIHVIITNADQILFTGSKLTDKIYYHHSGWRTGIKAVSAEHLLERKPDAALRIAIHGMLPKNRLGRMMQRHLRIYKAGEYDGQHSAQQPEPLVITTRVPKAKF